MPAHAFDLCVYSSTGSLNFLDIEIHDAAVPAE